MNCEKYQNLLSDLIDGSLPPEDHNSVETHLSGCVVCAEARSDLDAIVGFCVEHRGEYDDVPNERALWLRISNMIEVELATPARTGVPANSGLWFRLMNQSWQLSFPQLATAASALVIFAAMITFVGVRGFNMTGSGSSFRAAGVAMVPSASTVADRYRPQQQVIEYWNQRVELNKTRWNSQTRETFDRNMSVIDAAVNDSMSRLNQNPHDEVSEEILNAALSDKVELLKEFSAL
jgi:anti-sigma factor RsiW